MFTLIVSVLTMLILIDFIPYIQERCHWIKYVGVHVSVTKFDVNDGISMSIP